MKENPTAPTTTTNKVGSNPKELSTIVISSDDAYRVTNKIKGATNIKQSETTLISSFMESCFQFSEIFVQSS